MKNFLNIYALKIFGYLIMLTAVAHGFGWVTVPGPMILAKPLEVGTAFVVGGIFALFTKDEIRDFIRRIFNKKLNDGAKVLLILFTATLFLSSCKTSGLPIISEKHTHSDCTIVKEKFIPVPIPGSNVQLTQKQIDSIAIMLAKYQPGAKIIYLKDPSGATQMKIWRDSITGELMQKCETLERQAQAKITETERYHREQLERIQKQSTEEKKKWYVELGDKLESMFWKLVLVVFLFFLLREVIKFLIIHRGESGNKIKTLLGFK